MVKTHAPKSHPRYLSNLLRDKLSDGVKKGITSLQGLTAHGRGEAFDYLLGEKTHDFAFEAIEASAAMLLLAKYPVLSVNGNTAVLTPNEFIKLAKILSAKLEVNLFHTSKERERNIAKHLKSLGAEEVLLPGSAQIPDIESNRKIICEEGQAKADIVFVPLEDGDRAEGLIAMRKKVVTIDLNPLSRTAQKATITIVDNIIRTMPLLIHRVEFLYNKKPQQLKEIVGKYDNSSALLRAEEVIRKSKRLLR